MTSNNDRLHTGELYLPNDPELEKRQFGSWINCMTLTRPVQVN